MPYLYVISAPSLALAKIGFSKDDPVIKRFADIDRASPVALTLDYSIELVDVDIRRFERYVHGKLHDRRVRGEWFAVTVSEAIRVIDEAYESRICRPMVVVDDRFPKSMNKKYLQSRA
jgi:hypothetical protein